MTALAPDTKPAQPTGETPGKTWKAGTLTYTTTGLVVLFSWLLWGDFAWSMKDRTMGPVLQILLHKFSASDTLTGLLMGSLPSTISMILTPIAGCDVPLSQLPGPVT